MIVLHFPQRNSKEQTLPVHYFLRTARRQLGMSLREAARKAGISASTLYRYEEAYIRRIPEERINKMLELYEGSLEAYIGLLRKRMASERWKRYVKSRPEITADFLYELYLSSDEQGRRTILTVMRLESCRSRENGTED